MPVDKQQHTTLTPIPTTAESSSAQGVVQQSFHQQLRDHIRAAVQVVMEEIMRDELTQFVGAQWGESTPARKGYRNGSYRRDLATTSGQIQDLKVPRDREGKFHTQLFDRYSRYEEQVAEGVTQMFVSGTSTHQVGNVAQTLTGVAPSASAVSRLNHTLTEQFEAWRERPLLAHSRILYLDGIHFTVRHGSQTDSTIILTALAVDLEGNKDVLALRACAEEDKDGWSCLFQDLRTRGATQMDLMVTDGHDGLLAAVSALFSATPRQRCVVHKQRNVLNAIRHRVREEVSTELAGIFKQERKEDALLNVAASTRQIPEALSRSDPESL